MARTKMKVSYACSYDEAERKVSNILSLKGFKTTTLKTGEIVWKKGLGLMTAMQFIKIDFSQKELIVSAWVQVGIGSVGGREMDLTGVTAIIPKKS